MKDKKKNKILNIIIILSILGLITSLYLVKNHYAPPGEGAFCDVNAQVSCSLVNTSIFSELLGVPVALLGAIWFVILILMSWKAMKKDGALIDGILIWNLLGLLSVIYFVIAEIILKAL